MYSSNSSGLGTFQTIETLWFLPKGLTILCHGLFDSVQIAQVAVINIGAEEVTAVRWSKQCSVSVHISSQTTGYSVWGLIPLASA